MRTAWSSRLPWPRLPKRPDWVQIWAAVRWPIFMPSGMWGGFKSYFHHYYIAMRFAGSSKTLNHHRVGIGLLADPKRSLTVARKTETLIEGDGVLILAVDREPHAVTSAFRP